MCVHFLLPPRTQNANVQLAFFAACILLLRSSHAKNRLDGQRLTITVYLYSANEEMEAV